MQVCHYEGDAPKGLYELERLGKIKIGDSAIYIINCNDAEILKFNINTYDKYFEAYASKGVIEYIERNLYDYKIKTIMLGIELDIRKCLNRLSDEDLIIFEKKFINLALAGGNTKELLESEIKKGLINILQKEINHVHTDYLINNII